MTNRRQLELGLDSRRALGQKPRGRRMTRARWWFQQMRLAVDQASDWEPPAVTCAVTRQRPDGRN